MAFNKQKALEAARKAYDKGQKDKAIKEYLKVVREDPNDVRVWLKIGDLYAQKGEKQDATDTYLKVAKYYSEQGFYLKAVAVYKQVLKIDSRMVDVNLKLAELYRQLGLTSEAMQHFEMVAAHFHREGQTQEALATIRQLVELDPDNVATRIKLAELYSKEEMLEEAAAEFRYACEFLRNAGREDDFVKVAERLLWHKPKRIDLARELATMYLTRGDARRALQKLQVCFKADQRDVETLALLAQAFQSLDQKSKTVSVLKELAKVLAENGQKAQAAEVHRKILAYSPEDVDSLAYLGEKPKKKETPAPRPRAERLASIAEGAATNQSARASGSKVTGSVPIYDEARMARESFSKAELQTPPPDDDFIADLALDDEPSFGGLSSASAETHADEIVKILTETDVYVKYGLHQKALHHLERVFDLDPGNMEARERLKEIYVSQGDTRAAVDELYKLAEACANNEPGRAEIFLRELLEMDPDHVDAIALAQRNRLEVTRAMAPVEIVDEDTSDAIELDLGSADLPVQPDIEQILDFDDLDFDESVDSIATATSTHVSAPVTDTTTSPDPTMEVSLDQVEGVVASGEPDDLDFDSRATAGSSFGPGESTSPDTRPVFAEGSGMAAEEDEEEIVELDFDMLGAELIEESVDPGSDSFGGLLGDTTAPGPSDEVETQLERPPTSKLEDDLDEADFYISQGMHDEAEELLRALANQNPDNSLIRDKLAELASSRATDSAPGIAPAAREEESVVVAPRPAVMLENAIDENDAETHFDLGQAYRDMGLIDEAIKEFQKVLNVESKEVQCHLMIGMCLRDQGSVSEAITQFKAGVHVSVVSPTEKQALYYEIAISYESLSDPQEALYYYEILSKQEPDYRDIADRIARIRKSGIGGEETGAVTLDDETDAALDAIRLDEL